MQILSKLLIVLTLTLVTHQVTMAQTVLKKPDVIQKMDKTSLEVVIDEINKIEILYRKSNDPKGPLYSIPKKDVNKIIWNNGDIEEVNSIPLAAKKTGNPTDLLVKPTKPDLLFYDKKGLFAGLKAGIGAGMAASPGGTMLATDVKPAYNVGGTLGYRISKSLSIQADVLYTGFSYGVNLSGATAGIKNVEGRQANLVVPVTATVYTKIGKTRIGFTAGGFGSLQLGTGSLKVSYSEKPATNTKNCANCTDQLSYGVTGGVSAFVVEKPGYAIFIDAKWYQSLVNNSAYKNIAESGVKMNAGVLGAGVLFNISHD